MISSTSSWGRFFHPAPVNRLEISLTLSRILTGVSLVHRREAYPVGMSAPLIGWGVRGWYSPGPRAAFMLVFEVTFGIRSLLDLIHRCIRKVKVS